MDDGADFLVHLRQNADFCEEVGAALYAVLIRGMADDYAAGGPCRELFAGWADRPRDEVVQLRALGALHRVVLRRQAPELATYYRSVGGTVEPGTAWPVARAVIAERLEEVRGELEVAPQTNEPGRAAALAVGLAVAAQRHGTGRIRLLELGASAGLNLLVDRFRVTGSPTGPRWQWGPAGSPVDLSGSVLDGTGLDGTGLDGTGLDGTGLDGPGPSRIGGGRSPLPAADVVRLVDRRGCDLHPIDPLGEPGRLRLTSFVWPDHLDRHRRLAGALAVAAQAGPGAAPVDRADAAGWLAGRLAEQVADGVLTVVWHSIFRQYLDDAARAAVEAVIAAARPRTRLAHLALEFESAPDQPEPALTLDGEVLGRCPPHGVPLTLTRVSAMQALTIEE